MLTVSEPCNDKMIFYHMMDKITKIPALATHGNTINNERVDKSIALISYKLSA